jgi:hypothetical protein
LKLELFELLDGTEAHTPVLDPRSPTASGIDELDVPNGR